MMVSVVIDFITITNRTTIINFLFNKQWFFDGFFDWKACKLFLATDSIFSRKFFLCFLGGGCGGMLSLLLNIRDNFGLRKWTFSPSSAPSKSTVVQSDDLDKGCNWLTLEFSLIFLLLISYLKEKQRLIVIQFHVRIRHMFHIKIVYNSLNYLALN